MSRQKRIGMTRARAQEVLDAVARWHRIERKAPGMDEVGWVAFHFSCPMAEARHMLHEARTVLGERQADPAE